MAGSTKRWLLGLLIAIAAGCTNNPESRSPPSPAAKASREPVKSANLEAAPYRSEQPALTMQFPKGFVQLNEHKAGVLVACKDEKTGANINIRTPRLRRGDTLYSVYEELRKAPESMEKGKLIEEGDINIDGIPAKWLLMSHTQQGMKLRAIVFVLVQQTTVYMIFCTASEDA